MISSPKVFKTNFKPEQILPSKKWYKKFENYWIPSEKESDKFLNDFVNSRILNAILSQLEFEKSSLIDYYRSRGAEPVICNKGKLLSEGYYVLQAPLYAKRITPTLRHDSRR